MHRLVIGLAALAAVTPAGAWSQTPAEAPAAPYQGARTDPHARINITLEEYRRVSLGMDWATVMTTVRSRGHAVEGAPGQSRTTMTWAWLNPDGSGMTCVFRDGRLVEKRQSGLEPER